MTAEHGSPAGDGPPYGAAGSPPGSASVSGAASGSALPDPVQPGPAPGGSASGSAPASGLAAVPGLAAVLAAVPLEAVAAEIEAFVGHAGWDQRPSLYALVPTRTLAANPSAAALLGELGEPDGIPAESLTPIAQDELPDGPLDRALAQVGWPEEVVGCALCQEIVMLPSAAEEELEGLAADEAISRAGAHPGRREARLVVAVLRGGRAAGILRLRGVAGEAEDLLTGADLAPNLAAALAATLAD